MKKKLLLTAIVSVGMLVGCTSTEVVHDSNVTDNQVIQSNGTEDSATEDIKVISLGASYTQIIVDAGDGDKLIGIDSNSTEFGLGEDVVVFDMLSPDIEQILILDPDVVIVSEMTSAFAGYNVFEKVEQSGIEVVVVETPSTLNEIGEDIETVLDAVNSENDTFVADYYKELEEYREIAATIFVDDYKSVFFAVSEVPSTYSFGSGVFLNEAIELAGGRNVMMDTEGWLLVSEEEIVSRNPEYYFNNVSYVDDEVSNVINYSNFGEVTAIVNKDVYYIDTNNSSTGNHTILKAIKAMGEIMHPDYY